MKRKIRIILLVIILLLLLTPNSFAEFIESGNNNSEGIYILIDILPNLIIRGNNTLCYINLFSIILYLIILLIIGKRNKKYKELIKIAIITRLAIVLIDFIINIIIVRFYDEVIDIISIISSAINWIIMIVSLFIGRKMIIKSKAEEQNKAINNKINKVLIIFIVVVIVLTVFTIIQPRVFVEESMYVRGRQVDKVKYDLMLQEGQYVMDFDFRVLSIENDGLVVEYETFIADTLTEEEKQKQEDNKRTDRFRVIDEYINEYYVRKGRYEIVTQKLQWNKTYIYIARRNQSSIMIEDAPSIHRWFRFVKN